MHVPPFRAGHARLWPARSSVALILSSMALNCGFVCREIGIRKRQALTALLGNPVSVARDRGACLCLREREIRSVGMRPDRGATLLSGFRVQPDLFPYVALARRLPRSYLPLRIRKPSGLRIQMSMQYSYRVRARACIASDSVQPFALARTIQSLEVPRYCPSHALRRPLVITRGRRGPAISDRP